MPLHTESVIINPDKQKSKTSDEIQKYKEEKDEWISNQLEASGIKRKEYSKRNR